VVLLASGVQAGGGDGGGGGAAYVPSDSRGGPKIGRASRTRSDDEDDGGSQTEGESRCLDHWARTCFGSSEYEMLRSI